MPQRDGTGPMGQGSLTGRRMGLCQASNVVNGCRGFFGRMGSFLGVGYGRGHGRGFNCKSGNVGYRSRQGNFSSKVSDNQMLDESQQVEMLKRLKKQHEEDLKRITQELDKYKDNL